MSTRDRAPDKYSVCTDILLLTTLANRRKIFYSKSSGPTAIVAKVSIPRSIHVINLNKGPMYHAKNENGGFTDDQRVMLMRY